jgi:hypothetical protein
MCCIDVTSVFVDDICVQVFKGLSRRFGHAGTDRQSAYLTAEEIDAAASRNDIWGNSGFYIFLTLSTRVNMVCPLNRVLQGGGGSRSDHVARGARRV